MVITWETVRAVFAWLFLPHHCYTVT